MAKEPKTELKNTHQTREGWMADFYRKITPYIESCSSDETKYVLPANVRFNLGFTSRGRKGKRQAQVLMPEVTGDGSYEVIASADIEDRIELGGFILHSCGHLLCGPAHAAPFKEFCLRTGLNIDQGLDKAMPSKKLIAERLNDIVEQIGPLPHARWDFDALARPDAKVADRPKKQSARMLPTVCRSADCVFKVNLSRKCLDIGLPHCPKHGEMMEKPRQMTQAAE